MTPRNTKNEAAVALGRLGGNEGGHARRDSLSPERRSEIARRAALARWKGHPIPVERAHRTMERLRNLVDREITWLFCCESQDMADAAYRAAKTFLLTIENIARRPPTPRDAP